MFLALFIYIFILLFSVQNVESTEPFPMSQVLMKHYFSEGNWEILKKVIIII